jgi:hypothetical protein
MGMNAITVYVLAEGGIPDWFVSCFYLDDPDQNLQVNSIINRLNVGA